MSKNAESKPAQKPIVFRSLKEVKNFVPDKNAELLDSGVLEKGKVTVIGGKGGVGKSMLSMSLAIAGLRRRGDEEEWMGIPVLRPFRTLLIQTENGRKRLKSDIQGLDIEGAERNILVSDPPERGLRFDDEDFRECVRRTIDLEGIDLVIIDPWSAVIGSHGFDALRKAMTMIREVIGYGEKAPALLILAHTRKSKIRAKNFRATSIDELTGSQALGTDARCVFLLERANEDLNDDKVVFACVKNNDGRCIGPSVWLRKPVMFEPIGEPAVNEASDQKSEAEARKRRLIGILESEDGPLTSSKIFELMEATERNQKNCILQTVKALCEVGILEKTSGPKKSISVKLVEGADTSRYTRPVESAAEGIRSSDPTKVGTANEHPSESTIKGKNLTIWPFKKVYLSGGDVIRNAKRCRGMK